MPSHSRGALYPILLSLTLVWWGCSDEPDPVTPEVRVEGPDVAWLQANAVAFDSHEAETGYANLMVRAQVFSRFRLVARHAKILLAKGRVERSVAQGEQSEAAVVHLIVEELERIDRPGQALRTASRDFH